MPVSVRIEPDSGVAIATCTGVLRLREARDTVTALWADPAWPGRSSVWDFRKAEFEFSSSDVIELAGYVREHQPRRPPARVAFVTERDSDFGMARMFEAYRREPQTAFRVFRVFDEALSWARSLSLDQPS